MGAAQPWVYRFERFTLDLVGGALLGPGGCEVPLRPKSFALLRLFVENPNRLLDRDVIMAAVWPDVVVGDESITQCVREIRKALSDDAQRLVRTVPRRGYRFDAAVARVEHEVARRDSAATFTETSTEQDWSAPAAANGEAGAKRAERRQLTVLFCDLVDSTGLSEQLDPEDFSAIIRSYQRCCASAVERFGGQIGKYMGDGILAYFGYPDAREDAAERSVRAGLHIVATIPDARFPANARLQVRVGIATGLAVTEGQAAEGQGEIAVGLPLNLAARLQALAEPGTVLVAEATRLLLGELFALQDLGQHHLKNFAAPVRVWRVRGDGAGASRFEALRGAELAPLVGREPEMALLLERWEWSRSGEGQVVLLSGEPGIGKSRLTLELRERPDLGPLRTLLFQGSPSHGDSTLHPVIEQLERLADFASGDRPGERLAKLGALVGTTPTDAGSTLSSAATFLSIPTDVSPWGTPATPEQRKAGMFALVLHLIDRLTVEMPLLMVMEDAHWADPTTLELFEQIVERVQRLPILLVVTYRPEFSLPWGAHSHVTALSLNRLSSRQAATVVAQVAGHGAVPPKLMDQIVARADGVPLFVEELTKAFLETGSAAVGDGRSPPDESSSSLTIPATLQDSLLARLDRLAAGREVAPIGAAIGRKFSYLFLAAVAALPEDRLARGLDELVAAQLAFVAGRPPNSVYTFEGTVKLPRAGLRWQTGTGRRAG